MSGDQILKNTSLMMGYTTPPSLDDIQEMAMNVIGSLPIGLKKYVGKLQIEVEEFPDAFIEEELELDSPFDVLGIYQSKNPAAIGKISQSATTRKDSIILYRRPLLDAWSELGSDLTLLINRTILGEIGHHFGLTECEVDIFEEEMIASDKLIVCA